jgi:uncharacterized protein (TIRG00374 family)
MCLGGNSRSTPLIPSGGSVSGGSVASSKGEADLPTGVQPDGHRWQRVALVALVVGAMVTIIVIARRTLAESLRVLGHLDWTWFVLAVIVEGVSLTSFGLSRRRLLNANGHQIGFGSVMAITYASNALSISVPFAGTELAVVFSYRQFRRHGVDAATTGWSLAVSALFSTSALALVMVIGALAGGATAATVAGLTGAAIFLLPGAGVLLALRFTAVRKLLHRFLATLVGISQRAFGKPDHGVDGLEEFLDRVATISLPWPRYAEVFGLALVNWLADCGTLACAIHATGQPVPWRDLLLVYSAGAVVGSTGITPGGFAIVELALTAALSAAGLHASKALAAVLAYRLVNFWMILIGGWVLMLYLARRRRTG